MYLFITAWAYDNIVFYLKNTNMLHLSGYLINTLKLLKLQAFDKILNYNCKYSKNLDVSDSILDVSWVYDVTNTQTITKRIEVN